MAKKNIKTDSKIKKARQLLDGRQYREALSMFLEVIELDPRNADAFYMAGILQGMLGRKQASIQLLTRAVELRPAHVSSQYNLGISYRSNLDFGKAAELFQTCIDLKPDYKDAHNALAHVLMNLNRPEEAVSSFRNLVALDPGTAETRNNLGSVLQAMGHIDEAISCYEHALKLKPDLTLPLYGLGSALSAAGRHEDAINVYRQSLKVEPNDLKGYSSLLLALNYTDNVSPENILDEHRTLGNEYAEKTRHSIKYSGTPPKARPHPGPLRIGYVSADFREHSVACFIEPVLAAHHKDKFNIYCYSSVRREDKVTFHLKSLVNNWRNTSQSSIEQIVAQIKKDKIDILVDLSGHTGNNHLQIFMLKPAPVQITWIGYPNTTGIPEMDYRIVDAITDPPGYERFSTEQLVRLPGCFLCYRPPESIPDVGPLPCTGNSYITFGSFNNLSKTGAGVIRLWGRLLQQLPDAHLLVKNPSLTDEKTRERFIKYFIDAGARPGQLELMGHTKSRHEHLEIYNRVDIALDTFPYNGTATTCEALWMGVPVITLTGDRHAARVSTSLLTNAELGELVAKNEDEYIAIAKDLACDQNRLAEIRSGLRARIQASVLCNEEHFINSLEKSFTEIWETACDNT